METYGPQQTTAPAGAIILNPGDNISSIVNNAPAGSTFYFGPGVYRGVSLAPKNGQTFIGAEGAILNGSAVLTNWTQSGNLWVIGGQTQQGPVNTSAEFLPTTERPGHPDSVFLDNVPLTPVDALSKVVPGTFYLDYTTDQIYIADNPAGHTIEAGKQTDAFHGSATNVTVQNLVIEKYDPEIQNGAINANQSWTVQNNEVRLNYAVGITVQDGSQVIGNYVHDNGQMGVGGDGNNVLVQGNELASNGFWSGIDPTWEAGGLKFAQTDNLVVRGNYSHDNNGSGLWGDIDSINTLYEDNVVVHNTINGISYEISYNAIIRNNTLIGNGYGDTRGWGWGAEINIQNSQNVQVYGNRVDMTGGGNGIILIQQNRGSGAYGFYTTTGNQIHDNIIVDRDGHGTIGGFADYNQSGMLNGGNTWSNNQYFMSDGSGRFEWGGDKTFAQFKAAAHETGSISQSYPDTSGWLTGITQSGPIVSAGQLLVISTGQTSAGVVVLSSGTEIVLSGGVANGTVVSSGGVQVISSGSTVSGTTLSGGTQIDVGLAMGTVVGSGGAQYVYAGSATSTTVNSGGIEVTQNGGVASATTVNVGGVQVISSGATASGTKLSGGTQVDVGLAVSTVVGKAGVQYVYAGLATSTTVNSGGTEYTQNGGVASATTVNGGGVQVISSGTTASGTTLSGGTQIDVGLAMGTVVGSGGAQYVYAGSATSTTVNSGGIEVTQNGGVASATTVNVGGVQVISSGTTASGTTLSGGTQVDVGLAVSTVVGKAGVQYVYAGLATSTTVNSGGTEYTQNGGVASATTVNVGGLQVISSGTMAIGTKLSGGTLRILSGASVGTSTIAFGSGSGHLVLDDSQHFSGGPISGFGLPGDIDLVDIAFGSSTTVTFVKAPSNTSGTLTVSDGVHTAKLTLLGQYVNAQFIKASDGHGGTLISDPPISSGASIASPH